MLHVSDLYNLDSSAVGTPVQVSARLLGTYFDNLVMADSIADYDQGVAVPLLNDDLLERLVVSGVYGIGGARFVYAHNSIPDTNHESYPNRACGPS